MPFLKYFLFLSLIVGFFAVAGSASAATYYVDTVTGNDARTTVETQSSSTPWKTLIKAETAAITGDTVYVKTGIYTESSTVGGSTSNITFTKGITWVGKSADWSTDGMVTIHGATATTGNTVAGNTDALSITNFIFDGQGVSGAFVLNSGQANKSFTNCTFQGVNAVTNYGVWIKGGSVVNFASSTFSYGSSANSLFNLASGTSINITGTASNHSVITTTGAKAINASATSNVTLINTDITVTNPVNTVIAQSTAGATVALSITGGSITVTGGNREVIYWTGGVAIDGTTVNISGVSNFLDNPGTYASASIINADINITSSGYLFYTSGGEGTSLNISSSTIGLNMSYGGRGIAVGSSTALILNNNTITTGANFSVATLIGNAGSGATTVTNNRINISTGTLGTLVNKYAVSRTNCGDFNFSNNSVEIAVDYTSNLIYIRFFNGGLSIDDNVITATSDSVWSHSNDQYVIYINDVPNPVVINNTIKTHTTGVNEHIGILTSDSSWTGTGVANISGNTHYSNSGNGHIIALGSDGLTDLSKAQKWNGSLVRNNIIYGPGSGWDGTSDVTNYSTHDIFVGHNINCDIAYNKIIGGNLVFVIKDYLGMEWISGGVHDNIVINPTYGAVLSKGAQNLNIYNNSFYSDSIYANNYVIGIGENLVDFPTTGNSIFNNIIYGVATHGLIDVDEYSTANFRAYNNIYWNNTGNFLSQKFKYSGSTLTGFSSWNTAIGGGDTSILSDPKFTNITNNDATLQPTSPAISNSLNVSGRTADYLGNPIYGTPDIGAYEYQPPYVIGTDDINSTGNIRIYADGKYRYTTATSSDSVISFAVTPESGSFPTYTGTTTRPEWLNISDVTWNTSGDYSKQWTASSSLATTTIYTIGDLLPNTDYTIAVDGLASTTERSDSLGVITYTYSGGYSAHTFTVTDNTAPVAFGVPAFGSISTSSIEVIKPEVTPEDEADIYQWQIRRDGSLELGFNSTSTNSITDSGLMPNTEYVYDVQLKDRSLNSGTYGSSTSKYTLAGIPTNFSTTTVTRTSISFSVDSFPNATTSSSGYFFSRSGQDSGWIQTNVWQDTSLTCNTSYTYSVKYRNGNGVETESISLIPKTARCSSGGGGSTTIVEEEIIATTTIQATTTVATSTATTTPGNTANISSLADFINLLISLNLIPQDKINLAKTLLEPKTVSPPFTKDLEFGQTNPDVKRLQIFLNAQGFIVSIREGGVPGHETNYFGLKTKLALQKFQQAQKIYPVSGYFGVKTRGVVNEMMK